MGVRVIAQYAVLGPYDFVTVLEAPDNETVSRVSVELGARGSVQMMTMPAIPVDDFISRLAGPPRRGGSRLDSRYREDRPGASRKDPRPRDQAQVEQAVGFSGAGATRPDEGGRPDD